MKDIKMRQFHKPASILTLGLLIASSWGCGSSNNDSQAYVEPTATPTVTATPEPTATPLGPAIEADEWFALSSMVIADENKGFDLDGDGSVDNGTYAVMEALSVSLTDITTQAIADQGPGGACEASNDCSLTTQQVIQLTAAAQAAINLLVNVNALNVALQAPYNAGLLPYAIHTYVEEGNILEYWTGELPFEGDGYTLHDLISVQPGHISEESRVGNFATTQEMAFSFGIETPAPADDDLMIHLFILDPQTEMTWNSSKLSNVLLGGASALQPWIDYSEQILDYLVEQGILSENFDSDAALKDLESALIDAADITCSDGSACFSLMLAYDADTLSF